uniref:Uncharacterized protein n=1 Tax=Gibberella zeae TaxID=5518 RepID=A0A4E9EJB7_GIBZA
MQLGKDRAKIKTILETRKAPGARVLRDQLYPIKVDSMNRMVFFDQKFNILPGAIETLNQENEIQIAKVAWSSRQVNPKPYGSMVAHLTKSSDAKRLLQEHYFLASVYLSRPLDRNNATTAKNSITRHSRAARIECVQGALPQATITVSARHRYPSTLSATVRMDHSAEIA